MKQFQRRRIRIYFYRELEIYFSEVSEFLNNSNLTSTSLCLSSFTRTFPLFRLFSHSRIRTHDHANVQRTKSTSLCFCNSICIAILFGLFLHRYYYLCIFSLSLCICSSWIKRLSLSTFSFILSLSLSLFLHFPWSIFLEWKIGSKKESKSWELRLIFFHRECVGVRTHITQGYVWVDTHSQGYVWVDTHSQGYVWVYQHHTKIHLSIYTILKDQLYVPLWRADSKIIYMYLCIACCDLDANSGTYVGTTTAIRYYHNLSLKQTNFVLTPHSKRSGFYRVHRNSWTLISDNGMQVSKNNVLTITVSNQAQSLNPHCPTNKIFVRFLSSSLT